MTYTLVKRLEIVIASSHNLGFPQDADFNRTFKNRPGNAFLQGRFASLGWQGLIRQDRSENTQLPWSYLVLFAFSQCIFSSTSSLFFSLSLPNCSPSLLTKLMVSETKIKLYRGQEGEHNGY